MGPVTIAVLAGIGTAAGAWIAKKIADRSKKKTRGRADGKTRKPAPHGTVPGRLRPPQGPYVEPRDFVFRWANVFLDAVVAEVPPTEREERPTSAPGSSLSAKIAALINWLYTPMFWSGPVLLAWLFVELTLQYSLSAETYAAVVRYSRPIVAVIAPMTVGYWTNWLAIKMLFQPRRKNAVWHGLIAARRAQVADEIAESIRERLISPEIIRSHLEESGVVRDLSEHLVAATRQTIGNAGFQSELKAMLQHQVYIWCASAKTRQQVKATVKRTVAKWAGKRFGAKITRWTRPVWGPKVATIAEDLIPEIPGAVTQVLGRLDELLDSVPKLIEERGENIERALTDVIVEGTRQVNIKEIIRGQMNRMDEAELQRLLTQNVTKEIKFIQTSGGVFGGLVGLVILVPEALIALAGVGIAVWLIYARTVEEPGSEQSQATPGTNR